MLVFVDVETTGLDAHLDDVLEVAVVVTDDDLVEVASGRWVVCPDDPSWRERLAASPKALEMHTANGLVDEVDGGVPLAQAEREIVELVVDAGAEGAPMAGSSVRFDAQVCAAQLPAVSERLHYRLVDVSTLKELARRWAPQLAASAPTREGADKRHRADDDLRDTIAELAHYRQLFDGVAGGDRDAAAR